MRRRNARCAVGTVLLVALGALVFWTVRVSGPTTLSGHRAWYETQVAQIKSGVLVPDVQGVVRFSGNAIRRNGYVVDTAFVRGSATSGWSIFFPHWRGRGSNCEGYLYSTVPVGVGGAETVGTGVMGVTVERVIDPTWSLAAWRLD